MIGQVRLPREYPDAERTVPAAATPIAFALVLRGVVEQIQRLQPDHIELDLTGSSRATIAVSEPHLRSAQQYMVGALIERPGCRRRIVLAQHDEPDQSVLRAHSHGAPTSRNRSVRDENEDPAILISR